MKSKINNGLQFGVLPIWALAGKNGSEVLFLFGFFCCLKTEIIHLLFGQVNLKCLLKKEDFICLKETTKY